MIKSSLVLLSLFSCVCFAAPSAPNNAQKSQTQSAPTKAFKSFTGKVTASKVRMRLKPDLDSPIIRQLTKNDLLLIVAEDAEFYAVEPPKDIKTYIFRSYVLDDIVEASKVNVRLEPHPDAPIVGQLDAGTKVHAKVCSSNHKWLEIAPPSGSRFYVSKEFVESAGGPDYIVTMEKRKKQVEELMASACKIAEEESKKNYEEMSIFTASEQLQAIIRGYSDFPEAVHQSKEILAHLKEAYLNKKISFLEARAELSPVAKQELIAKHKEETKEYIVDTAEASHPNFWMKKSAKKEQVADMKFWDSLEESLYLSWTSFHSGKKIEDFYAEQKANAVVLKGKVEPYNNPVKDKPGNFILKSKDNTIGYLYSTHVDLEKLQNKAVTIYAAPRPNNHFAFPAFFVLEVE